MTLPRLPISLWPSAIQPQRIITVTGHRPDKLGGYDNCRAEGRLYAFAMEALIKYAPDCVITGMALGFDIAIAAACTTLKIPFVAAIPFYGQACKWPIYAQERYLFYVDKATVVHVVNSSDDWMPGYFQDRNKWMIDRCYLVLALWNGSRGGTANCIKYAESKGVQVNNLWKDWEQWQS